MTRIVFASVSLLNFSRKLGLLSEWKKIMSCEDALKKDQQIESNNIHRFL